MKDTDIKRLLYTNLLCVFSIFLSIFIPSFFVDNFSVLEAHLTWLCICSASVTTVNLLSYLVVKPNVSSKRSSLSHKVRVTSVASLALGWRLQCKKEVSLRPY